MYIILIYVYNCIYINGNKYIFIFPNPKYEVFFLYFLSSLFYLPNKKYDSLLIGKIGLLL